MSGTPQSYDEFFLFYLREHSHPGNRALHACGTALGLLIFVGAFALHHPWFALLWLPVGYGFAWFGHFLLEGNRPATFRYPLWSFISDFHMLSLMLTGRLASRLAQAQSSGAQAGAPAISTK
jgi:hypothetical protein